MKSSSRALFNSPYVLDVGVGDARGRDELALHARQVASHEFPFSSQSLIDFHSFRLVSRICKCRDNDGNYTEVQFVEWIRSDAIIISISLPFR